MCFMSPHTTASTNIEIFFQVNGIFFEKMLPDIHSGPNDSKNRA